MFPSINLYVTHPLYRQNNVTPVVIISFCIVSLGEVVLISLKSDALDKQEIGIKR